jgi:hypothetical protein
MNFNEERSKWLYPSPFCAVMNTYNFRNKIFYILKPVIPRQVQIAIRRRIAQHKRRKNGFPWPIDARSAKLPENWPGWPGGKQFALILSHDVDTLKGYNNVLKLADVEEEMGFRSQFNFVPERYGVISLDLLAELKQRGFGIGVHGLKHDGKLFSSKMIFDERAPQINAYLKKWDTRGFTTPSMIRNHDWMHALDMSHCVSTFDTDPFEPEPVGVATIFPFWVQSESPGKRFLEMPYTLVQDFTLFVILGEKTNNIWKQKLDWIACNKGMVLLNSHPDYKNFGGSGCGKEEYPVQLYRDFLEYARSRYCGQYWAALPQDIWSYLNISYCQEYQK